MNDHPHFGIARELWSAIANADVAGLQKLVNEKCVWRMGGNSLLAGSYVGPDEILGFMARVGDLADELHSELLDIYVSDSGAVLHYSVQAVRGSRRLDTQHLFLTRIESGRITEAVFAPIDQVEYDRFFSDP